MESSLQGKVIRQLIAHASSDLLIGEKIRNGELRKKLVTIEPRWRCPEGFTHTEITMDDFKMEWLEAEENTKDRVILQLHGGGYIAGMRNAYRTFAVVYSELGGNINVLTPDYRVAPECPFPAALEDAYNAYQWLLFKGYRASQIILAGDSAGGGLVMALCFLLRQRGKEMPLGIIAMSPWTDLTQSGDSYVLNYEKDPLFGKTKESMIYNKDYVKDADPKNPYISPVCGDFKGFPPMLIQVGSYEMLLSDSVTVAEKAKKAGVKVKLSIYKGMFHVFQMGLRMMPESKEAWKEVEEFLKVLEMGVYKNLP